MATKNYTTSVTVNFSQSGGDDSQVLKAEIDSRDDGLNGGITTFIPGVDTPYILVFKSNPVVIDSIVQSSGSMINMGVMADYEVSEFIVFANEREQNLPYPVSSGFSAKWVGTAGGAISNTETTIYVPENTIGVVKVTYIAKYIAYKLTGVPAELSGETEFPVVVFISGHA